MNQLQFDGQREGEEVKLVFRRHILTAKRGLGVLLMVGGLGFLPMLLWTGRQEMFWIFLTGVVLGILGMLYVYLLWYCSVFIVTNERIRQVSQCGLFKKNVTDLSLSKIESLSYQVPGIVAGMCGYGTLLIQTGVGDWTMSKIAKPNKVYNEIENLLGRTKNENIG